MKKVWKLEKNYVLEMIIDGRTGICLACGEIGQCAEPDAKNYTCDWCGCETVYGIEEAVIEGYINEV